MILTVLIVLLTTVIPVIIVTYDQHTVADPGIEFGRGTWHAQREPVTWAEPTVESMGSEQIRLKLKAFEFLNI